MQEIPFHIALLAERLSLNLSYMFLRVVCAYSSRKHVPSPLRYKGVDLKSIYSESTENINGFKNS